ncbi:MAG: VCBS repeat-containing protein [Woeseiaceae bacterium]|nr:VCBS repeat-containing protein [Woeseiaceae bacterium]
MGIKDDVHTHEESVLIMGSLRTSSVIVSMGLALIGSAAAYGETVSVHVGPIAWAGDPDYMQVGDFNGDGAVDIFNPWPEGPDGNPVSGSNGFYIYGPFSPSWIPPRGHIDTSRANWGATNYTFAGDFNGDGRDEIVTFIGGTGRYMPQRSDVVGQSSFSVENTWGAGNYTFAGDFNGDGRDDIASAYGSTVYMKLGRPGSITTSPLGATGPGFTSTAWDGASNEWGGGDYTFAGDFNGDGRADIASMYGSTAYMKLSTGSGFTSVAWPINGTWGGSGYTFAGDFNGDGMDDIATAIGNRVYLKYSTGTGFRYGGSQVVGGSWGHPGSTWVVRRSGRDEIASANGYYVHFHRFEESSGGGGGGGPRPPGDRCRPLCQ